MFPTCEFLFMEQIYKIFDILDDWRHLPAYQLERRSDIFFASYLPQLIKAKFSYNIDFIIPEFPIRIGHVSDSQSRINQSFRIDYLLYDSTAKKVFLLELKTDQNSRREKQDWYLEQASKIGIVGIIDGLIEIYKASSQKNKYRYLLNKLEEMGWIKRVDKEFFNQNIDIIPEIIYLQPTNQDNLPNIISFEDVISILRMNPDPFSDRFCVSLEKWKNKPGISIIRMEKF